MWINDGGTIFISMPGVPFEMKHLMQHEVLPKLTAFFRRPHIIHKTVITYGLGESAIAERIEEWEDKLPPFIKLAYLPNLGKVRLRLTAKGTDREKMEEAVARELDKLYPLIQDILFGTEDNLDIEEVIAGLLTKKGWTLATAESFTGGKIAETITAIPGASAYFKGSVVCYATEVKTKVLHVPQQMINDFSVVSEPVAVAMAKGVQQLMQTDFAIATTGNAGPTKGDSQAEVGSVFIGIATPNHVFAQEFQMGNHRERIVQKSVNKAFEMLQKEILKM
jgi:nicotinamide-nucleotide amidase